MGNLNNIRIILMIAMFFLVSTSSVLAFAISAPYSKNTPLKMYPGETKDVSFVMQNLQGNADENVVVSLLEGKEIADITSGNNYLVRLGTSDTQVKLRINVPSDVAGKTYNVKFSVQSSPGGKEGNIQLGVGYNVDFPVIVMEKSAAPAPTPQEIEQPQENSTWAVWVIAIIIAIVIIIILVIWFWRKERLGFVKLAAGMR